MRILKRNLAFMLAMIMALSLTAFAGYEDYPDVDELTYVEAVDVLTELGIVEGSNGKLLPTGNLTRAQAAKLIAYTMLGKKAADALQAEVAPFVDVPTYHWAAGYVEYCADQGIIGGRGNGIFDPESDVTASEYAKMLLCAVGYGEKGEFTGASWDSTVNAQGTKLGIFDGNEENVVFAKPVTREEAFLYTFNALTKVMEVTYSADADEYYAGTVFNSIKGFDAKETLGYKLYNLKKVDGVKDAFGRDSYNWYKGSKKIAGLYADAPKAVYTTKVKGNAIYADLDLTATTKATVYKNGVAQADFQLKKGLKNDLPNSGNGVLVEAYVVDEQVTLIMVDTFLAKVKAVNSKDDEVTLNVHKKNGTVVTYNDVVVDLDLAKNDYVLVTIDEDNNEIVTVAIPETVEGQLDNRGQNSDYTTMAGTKYSHSFNLNQTAGSAVWEPAFETDMIMILDEYGYMIGLVKADTAAKSEGYVLVKASQGALNETFLEKGTVKAEVMYMATGETEIVNLATKLNGTGLNRTAEYWNPAKVGGAGWSPVAAESFIVDYGFYGYYMDANGEMRLLPLDAENRNEEQVLSVAKTAGKTAMDAWGYEANAIVKNDAKTEKLQFGTKTPVLKINSATTLHLVSKNGVESIEGYKNFEINEENVDALVVYNNSSKYVSDIYVVDGDLHNNVVGYYNSDEHMLDKNGEWITLYVGGEAQTYKLTANTKLYFNHVTAAGELYAKTEFAMNTTNLVDGAYKFTLDGNTLESLTLVAAEELTNGLSMQMQVKDLGTNWIKLEEIAGVKFVDLAAGMTRKYTLADDVQIYDVVNGGVETSIDLNDKVIFVVDQDATNTVNLTDADETIVVSHVYVVGHVDNQVVTPDTQAAVAFTKNGNTWRFDFANLKAKDKVVITAYNYAEGIDGVYAAYSFEQVADGANGFEQTYNIDAQMSFVVTINGTLVYDGPVYSFVE